MASPQTDAFMIEGGNYSYAGLANHTRRLERERDEARELLRIIRERAQCTDTGMGEDIRAILAKAKP